VKFDQHIKEVALLGTSKRKIDLEKLPPAIAGIVGKEEGNEAKLLAAITSDFFYKKAGTLPPEYQGEITGEPITEDKEVAPKELIALFRTIQSIDGPVSKTLFNAWCNVLIRQNWIVPPDQIIPVLNTGTKQIKDKIVQLVGKKGTWAIQQEATFKKDYSVQPVADINAWEEGTTNERVIHLQKKREEDSSQAQSMLEDTWATESIQTKKKFLETIQQTAVKSDIPFLASLHKGEFKYSAKEKVIQIKCRRIIAETLLGLPASDLHQHTIKQLKQYVKLPEGKNFLKKLISNDAPKLELPETTDDFWNPLMMTGVFGFEAKNVDIGLFKTDALYWFSCFVQIIPLDSWNEIFGFKDNLCLEYFTGNETFLYKVKGEQYSCLTPSLKALAVYHQEERIAGYLLNIKHLEKDVKLLYVLSQERWEAHIIQNKLFFDGTVLRSCKLTEEMEWSQKFSEALVMAILKKLKVSAIYDYQIGQYAAMRFNEDSIPMIEKMNQTETSELKKKSWWDRHFYEPIIEAVKIKSKLKKYYNGNA